jgi:hypothetical protein
VGAGDRMHDETRTRFLTAIARQLPVERVIEVHLFAAMRQGGVESGIAVIALERDEASVQPLAEESEAPSRARASRYTIFSARYRYTLKGLDRGKWEVSVTEEADAPLVTIDAVVRGVHRRSGDVDNAIRLSGDEFRAALHVMSS